MKQPVLQNNLQNLLESAENILLLQGPVGDFFLRLADWLTANGKTVHKFNFNAGDDYFYPPTQAHTVVFNDNYDAFPEFLQEYIVQHHIQRLSALATHALITSLQNALQTKTKPVSGHLKKAISAPTTSP